MAILIKVDGSQEIVTPVNGKKFTLEEMQKLVDGYIQPCDTIDKRRMVVDEDGKPKGKPVNYEASKLYQYGAYDMIVGVALVGSRKEIGV